ncbi:MAG: hypothetical protein M0R49_07990 [Limnochordia bacterium]|jgi:hypothetical protein|nr:hypothetical protein [Limnochordia bacterium]
MGMGKHKIWALVVVLLLVSVHGIGLAQTFTFTDPTDLFTVLIPDNWVYQGHHSTPQVTVFYGGGDYDLFYVESLGKTSDASVQELAERTLELYALPGGLEEFKLERPLHAKTVAGQWGLACAYTYIDGRGNSLVEYRIFLLLSGNQGFSIALSSDQPWVMDSSFLEDVLLHWRWLF